MAKLCFAREHGKGGGVRMLWGAGLATPPQSVQEAFFILNVEDQGWSRNSTPTVTEL